MKIRKPTKLIRGFYEENGSYCSIGWLGKEAGVEYIPGKFYLEDVAEAYDLFPVELGTLMRLNDRADDKKRIPVFLEWCENKGIEIYD